MTQDIEQRSRGRDDAQMTDDDVRELIERAGHRPDIPAGEFLAIKANARADWRQMVDSRRRQRRWWSLASPLPAAAGILIVFALVWWWRAEMAPSTPATVASIELLSGDVWIEEPDTVGETAPTDGSTVAAGSVIATGSSDSGLPSLVAARLVNGQSVRLRGSSRARLLSGSQIELMQGTVYIDSGTWTGRHSIEVSTPFGSVTDIGTQFEVRLGETISDLRVRVRSGSISLIAIDTEHAATGGEELLVASNGSVSRGAYDPAGSEWDWILSAAPSLEIEDLPLSDFLSWVSAETGMAIDYEDQVLAGAVTTIRLHGTIEGLRPDEAIVAVLPGTGLVHEIEAGRLRISRGKL